jgi:dTDP-4-dehydrorhamnose 3,5-epimerase
MTAGQSQRGVGADEAGAARHEDAHGAIFSNVPPMRAVPTGLEGAILLEPAVHGDERGFFLETFRRSTLDDLGLTVEFVQDNQSRSRRGIVRGMHFQPGMAKLVRCARGAIFDVVVDVRRGSPSFGRWVGFELNDVNHHQLFCPDGFAHGFCVLSEVADVAYKTSSYYAPELEGGFAYNDPDVAIAWPAGLELIASPRDSAAPRLAELGAALPFEYATMQS